MSDDDQMRADVAEALEAVMRKHGAMLGKWHVVAEAWESDGERACWVLSPATQPLWDTLGLLAFADMCQDADD